MQRFDFSATADGVSSCQNGHYTARSQKPLRMLIATPRGKEGEGGVDRLNDSIIQYVKQRPELNVRIAYLVTRGRLGLFVAQFIFGYALIRFVFLATFGCIDLLHIHLSIR